MALTLPTFTITNAAKEDRLLDAFRPTPTSSDAEAAGAYRAWLASELKQRVLQVERIRALAQVPPADDLLD